MAFAGGMHVFPGGRVDAADHDPGWAARSPVTAEAAAARMGGDLTPADALAAHVAAIREAFEEVGVLLADHRPGADLEAARDRLLAEPDAFPAIAAELDLRLHTDRLVALSRWVTPPTLPRRFDARFFAASIPDAADGSLVGDEVEALVWHRPADALEAMADGRIGLWLPTAATLQQLEHVADIDEVGERLAAARLGEVVVEVENDEVVRIEMPAGGGVPGQPVSAYLVGRRAFVLVDPGDPTGPALERAIEVAAERGGTIRAIALTHVDADHASGAEALAEMLGVPVHAGSHRARRVPYAVLPLGDGDRLDAGDVPLRIVGTPGPTTDHLAFVVGDGRLAISGDLDGIRGARAVPGPADETRWRASIDRLRVVAPAARWLGGHPGADAGDVDSRA